MYHLLLAYKAVTVKFCLWVAHLFQFKVLWLSYCLTNHHLVSKLESRKERERERERERMETGIQCTYCTCIHVCHTHMLSTLLHVQYMYMYILQSTSSWVYMYVHVLVSEPWERDGVLSKKDIENASSKKNISFEAMQRATHTYSIHNICTMYIYETTCSYYGIHVYTCTI